ncbi:hypothetical protein TIFTF001_002033 [Ficus carica]|uniref:Uncharacterized protein n=1 Tax=Ficus carica TaxID=3494 RepID=A0AA88CNG4_FICCA|nr:hypothetical protein TIFTF001_002033 [Ficus carica]
MDSQPNEANLNGEAHEAGERLDHPEEEEEEEDYKSQPHTGDGASPGKIFIGGIARETTSAQFVKHFGKYGEIIDSVIMKDRKTGQPRGFGFVTYADPSVVDKVIQDNHIINGKQVEIKRTIPRGAGGSKDFKTKKIFVGGIPTTVNEDEFRDFFSQFGEVKEHQSMRDHATSRSRGFGFITFETEQSVDDLLAKGNKLDMAGSQYRTFSQFQQLSDRGSEIRTNNDYSLRGGRDGYRKLDQENFKKNGKWEKRDGLWLDQQTGADGELKDPACKKVSELIMEYNTQESQGTFESVGTSDVLTQALSRPEHPGRIRGQSKFVKPSQYFNLNRSSNRDNELILLRREIEELKALVRGLCANKDVEPSFDQENVPTVDQHNSFKASCSVQEKQHRVFDPPTMPVDSQKCKLYIFDEVHGGQLLVAFGRAWLESLPTDTVHGIPLGEGNVRVSINVSKLKKAALPIPTYEATTVEDVVNGFVAWPKTLVELDTSVNKASRGPSHVPDPAADRKKRQKKLGNKTVDSRTEVQQDAQQHETLFDFNKMNREMRFLAYYAHSSMRQGNQIEVPIPYTIMGFGMPVFLSFDDIYEFINLQEISANCILVYMRYLEELCRINGQAEKFVFVSPTLISPVRIDIEDAGMRERADILVSFLRDAPKGRLYLVPYNRGRHWVLGVIDPWDDLVLYFDPLREKKRDDFTELINMALTDWKIMAGEGIRRRQDCKTKISNCPCPLQEGSVECGYFVLGFMRDIVLNGIDVLKSKEFFTSQDLDLIKGEWVSHVMQFINYDM